jgi:hypothetical protein
LILFLSDTTRSIITTPSDFPFLLPRFDLLFLFYCLVLGLLELGLLAFSVRWVFFLGWFEVPHVYGSDFHLWMYHIYTTPCIYLLKNLNRTLFFKKIRFYFITDLFSLTEPSLRIRKNDPAVNLHHPPSFTRRPATPPSLTLGRTRILHLLSLYRSLISNSLFVSISPQTLNE